MPDTASRDRRAPPLARQTAWHEEEARLFLGMVGDRVRNVRSRKGMSRHALAERSGVSLRYLAQLEGGDGNISIGLLRRVAAALDVPIDWLVSKDDPWSSDAVPMGMLFQQATAEQRAKVLQILDPEHPSVRRARRFALIGLRGAGKSTLGRLAADALAVPFRELNHEIERASGMAVADVFALSGQEGYRRLERQAVEQVVADHTSVVVAVAGGIVSEPATFDYLLRRFNTIWLKARPEEHMARVRGQGDERPMAGNPEAMQELKDILASREALYARASAVVDTSARTVDQSIGLVLKAIAEMALLEDGSDSATQER